MVAPLLLDEVRTRDQLIACLFDIIQGCASKLIDVHEAEFADKIVARGMKAAAVHRRILDTEIQAGGLL